MGDRRLIAGNMMSLWIASYLIFEIVIFITWFSLGNAEEAAKAKDIVVADSVAILPSTSGLYCYTCMSENIPAISRRVMKESINLPEYAESKMCTGPLPVEADALIQNNIKAEPCKSACVKVVSENKYLKIVIRGCLDKLYATGVRPPLEAMQPDAGAGDGLSYGENCDQQKHESAGIGDTITDTCLCTTSYCNDAQKVVGFSAWFLGLVSIVHLLSKCLRI